MAGVRILLVWSLFSAIRHAFADMDLSDLNDDSYTRVLGSEIQCPEKIRFRVESQNIPVDRIRVNEETDCEGEANIPLSPINTPQGEPASAPVRYLSKRADDVERFFVGRNTAPFICELHTFLNDLEWVFFSPDDKLEDVKWTDIYGTTPKFAEEGDDIDFEDDERYLLISDMCFYIDSSITDNVCFPADASVQLENGSVKTMDKLSIGDRVQVGHGIYSDIFAWTHKTSDNKYKFVQLTTEDGNKICATGSHYIYADGESIQMKRVRVGMSLRLENGSATGVVKKERVVKTGLYNPQTVTGDIVVNGIMTTTYTAAVQPEAAHALLAPVRAAFQAFKRLVPEWASAS